MRLTHAMSETISGIDVSQPCADFPNERDAERGVAPKQVGRSRGLVGMPVRRWHGMSSLFALHPETRVGSSYTFKGAGLSCAGVTANCRGARDERAARRPSAALMWW